METQKLIFNRTTNSEIVIGNDIFKEIAAKILRSRLARHCAIVTNETVAKWYLQPLVAELRGRGIRTCEIVIGDGEKYKSFDTVDKIISKLCDEQIDRDCMIIALGGGVVCDLTGFVASIFKRGIPLVLIPTSLLAMVDACIGGKTGINSANGKNLIGTFYQPILSAIDVSLLQTLPLSQLTYGLVEAIKHALICDSAYYLFIQKNIDGIKSKQNNILQRLIRRSIHIKKSFIANDELDHGKRMYLNFGHTFGHALETSGEYIRLHHGEAVALGMLMAAKASHAIGQLEIDYSISLKTLLSDIGLPISIPSEFSKKRLLNALTHDKKRERQDYRFVLPQSPGKTFIHTVSPEKIEDFLQSSLKV